MRSNFFGFESMQVRTVRPVWAAFVAVVASGFVAFAAGCSSSPSDACPANTTCIPNGSKDAASDVIYRRFDDAANAAESSTVASTGAYDGTSGLTCKTNSDCLGDGGPGINVCSSTQPQSLFYNVDIQIWSTPICIVPAVSGGNCDPGTDADTIHFCDGPDDPTLAAGICIPLNPTAPVTGQGICLPLCTFADDGTAAKGCLGHNACVFEGFLSSTPILGVGYCQGACETKADCADLGANYDCQVDLGSCTMAPVTRTKKLGDACTTAGTTNDETQGTCYCAAPSGGNGFCSSECTVGGTSCPAGWVCETGEPNVLDPTLPTLTKQTTGMVGTCLPACSLTDGGVESGAPVTTTTDAATDDGSVESSAPTSPAMVAACPGGAACIDQTIAGPDCFPQ
jgi:hypothetical protein